MWMTHPGRLTVVTGDDKENGRVIGAYRRVAFSNRMSGNLESVKMDMRVARRRLAGLSGHFMQPSGRAQPAESLELQASWHAASGSMLAEQIPLA